uniref:C-type lectin domain-containing protein n=1 Tax=Nannospalax galili TaxID=1026970 RepID=A0A8C6RZM4_NANGA
MVSENIYANTNFKNESDFSDTNSTSPPCPHKKPAHESCHSFSKFLLATFTICFLLLTILLSVVFIKYSQVLKEKPTIKELNYIEVECTRQHSLMGDQIWSCCPESWKPFSSECYFISSDSGSWNESKENCSSMGAHLLVIHSKEEQTSTTASGLLIFVQNPIVGNAFILFPFRFWHPTEPNNVDEQCVVLNHPFRGWGRNDVFCSRSHRFICQMKKMYL